MRRALVFGYFLLAAAAMSSCGVQDIGQKMSLPLVKTVSPNLKSLSDLSVETLRSRSYGADIKIETRLEGPCVDSENVKSLPDANGTYKSYMASYKSDGLRVYTRINVPDGTEPEGGFPVIIFAHGWVGAEAAPSYTLGCDPASMYSEITDAYARAGFLVFIPGYRGHATVNDIPGDGIEYMEAWDNGTYLSTIFYSVDVLNLMAGMKSSGVLSSIHLDADVNFRTDGVNLSGHSQGGDVALTVLAAVGEGADNGLQIDKAVIWSGAIADRLTQMRTYHPLQKTPEAFVSGDGTWTGSAIGAGGEVNPNFIFGYPYDWIETPHPDAWTWQKETWSFPSVKSVLEDSLTKTYEALNMSVDDISGAAFDLMEAENGEVIIRHDPDVAQAMRQIGGYDFDVYLSEDLVLHFPDRDLVSLPAWNYDLCTRVNNSGGDCIPFEYFENNHGMRVSQHDWFASEDAVDGYASMVARDIAFFGGQDPSVIKFPPAKQEP